MIDQPTLVSLKKGDPVNHYLLVNKSEIRLTKTGKEYLFLELSDKSTSLISYVWDNFESIYKVVRAGTIVKVSGTIDDFQGTSQIRIQSFRDLNESDNVSVTDFQPKSPRNLKEMQNELFDRIESIQNSYLKSLMKIIF